MSKVTKKMHIAIRKNREKSFRLSSEWKNTGKLTAIYNYEIVLEIEKDKQMIEVNYSKVL